MATGIERQMKEEIEQASIQDLMPGFDTEMEWQQLNKKLHPVTRQVPIIRWFYAAAAIALIVVSVLVGQMLQPNSPQPHFVLQSPVQESRTVPDTQTRMLYNLPSAVKVNSRNTIVKSTSARAKEIITNGTPCPIAIRISQTMKCPDGKPAAISTRSTMEPGQTAQLAIKPKDSAVSNCSFTIREIEITSIATGETIVLNSSSTPSTAQEVYSYITGQKKGDVLAGMFTADCNNQRKKQSLTLASRDGGLVLQ